VAPVSRVDEHLASLLREGGIEIQPGRSRHSLRRQSTADTTVMPAIDDEPEWPAEDQEEER
jgi:hypothetical protein